MARRRKERAVEGGGSSLAWLFTFSDVLTLLITFFVLLISMSSMDSKKLSDTFGFFRGALGNLEGAKGREGSRREEEETRKPKPMVKIKDAVKSGEGGPSDQLRKELATLIRMSRQLARRLVEASQATDVSRGFTRLRSDAVQLLGEKEPIEVERTDSGLDLRLHVGLLFMEGGTQTRPEATDLVAKLADILDVGATLARIETPTRESGVAVTMFSPWELAGWRSASLIRRLGARRASDVAAAVVGNEAEYIRFVVSTKLSPNVVWDEKSGEQVPEQDGA